MPRAADFQAVVNSTRAHSGLQIHLQDRHREIVRQLVVLIVAVDDADEFLADEDLRRIVLPRPRLHADGLIAEEAAEVALQLLQFLDGHSWTPVSTRASSRTTAVRSQPRRRTAPFRTRRSPPRPAGGPSSAPVRHRAPFRPP